MRAIGPLIAVFFTSCFLIRTKTFQAIMRQRFSSNEKLDSSKSLLLKQKFQLDTTLGSMTQGLCIFDANKRLLICNKRYADIYNLPLELTRPGTPHETIVAHRIAQRLFVKEEDARPFYEANGTSSEVRSNGTSIRLKEFSDGRFIQIVRERAGDGWVATHEDVTDKVKAGRAIQKSERRFSDLFEFAPDGMLLCDAKGLILNANSEALKMFGYEPGELVGRPLEILMAEKGAPNHSNLQSYFSALPGRQSREIVPLNTRGLRKDGSTLLADVRIGAIDSIGEKGICVTVRDVTEVKTREESFRLLFDRNPVPMWVIDCEHMRFLAINTSAVTHYGYAAEQFMSLSALDLRPAEDREHFARSFRTRSTYDLEKHSARHIKADGTIINVHVFSRALVYEGHKARLVAIHDITRAKQTEEELRKTKNFLDTIVENTPLPIVVKSISFDEKKKNEYRFTLINRAAEALFERSRDEIVGKSLYDVLPNARAEFVEERDNAALQSRDPMLVGEHVIERSGSNNCVVTAKKVVIRDEAGEPQHLLTILEDITERKQVMRDLYRAQRFLDAVIEHVPAAIAVKEVPAPTEGTRGCRYMLLNRAGEELLGVSHDEVIGKTAAELYTKETADGMIAADREAIAYATIALNSEHSLTTPGNGTRVVAARRIAILDEKRDPRYLLSVLDDITERQESQRRIEHLAHCDELTGLANRARFNEVIRETITRASQTRRQFAMVSIDLDHFKEANDSYGHLIGDKLLCDASHRMQDVAEGAFVARLGGDEFVYVVEGVQPASAEALVDRLLAAFERDFEVDGHRIKLGLSAGVAIYPSDGVDERALLTNVDAALYRAKAEARGAAVFFESEMGDRLRDRLALQDELKGSVDRGELELYYQPQMKLSGETVGFEALVRWRSPKRGFIDPGSFIPIAEESGTIVPIGEWVLREACREAGSWRQPLTVAVNISPVQFERSDLPRIVHSVLLETGLAPGRLELEITEGVMIKDFSRAVAILNRLKSLGVKIVMDDFGTGFSSLSYLHSFRGDKVKIDRVFVYDLETNHHSKAIVRAIIGLGRSLNLSVLAEGVETEGQYAVLLQEGCDEVQGYLTGAPLPIGNYARLVGRQTTVEKECVTIN